eukprot:9919371-Prorocentrum_lima.AAC.1
MLPRRIPAMWTQTGGTWRHDCMLRPHQQTGQPMRPSVRSRLASTTGGATKAIEYLPSSQNHAGQQRWLGQAAGTHLATMCGRRTWPSDLPV